MFCQFFRNDYTFQAMETLRPSIVVEVHSSFRQFVVNSFISKKGVPCCARELLKMLHLPVLHMCGCPHQLLSRASSPLLVDVESKFVRPAALEAVATPALRREILVGEASAHQGPKPEVSAIEWPRCVRACGTLCGVCANHLGHRCVQLMDCFRKWSRTLSM